MVKTVLREITLIIFFLLIVFVGKAQTEYVVTVNPFNGTITKIDSIRGVRWLQSSPAYNETAKEYTFVGTFQPGQSPSYLYTLNTLSGNINSNPIPSDSATLISSHYSRATGILYGIILKNGIYSLSTINKTTGTYTIIKTISGIDGVGEFTIDEATQRLYIRAVDGNPNFAIWTIDLITGDIINHVSTRGIIELRFDNITNKIYALANRSGPTLGSYILSICTVNPVTGIVTNIADIPNLTGIVSSGNSTFNENDHTYFFLGVEDNSPGITYLYSIDVNTGVVLYKIQTPGSGTLNNNNLVFFRYDNISRKLYALFWEAITIRNLPISNNSNCTLETNTKVYYKSFNHLLIVDKNPTICKVTLSVYNMLGQLMLNKKIIKNGYNEISLPNVSLGIYFYELVSEGKKLLSGKFFK